MLLTTHFLMPPRFMGDHWAICLTIGNVDRLMFRTINKKFFMWEYWLGRATIKNSIGKGHKIEKLADYKIFKC